MVKTDLNNDVDTPTIGIIRVVTTDDTDYLETHARLISEHIQSSKLKFVTECIREFPDGIPNMAEERRAVPFVKETGMHLVQEAKVDSLLVSCAADPGVLELKQEVRVPVIGAGSASAFFSLMLGTRICVLGIEEKPPDIVQDILGDSLVGYIKPSGVKTTYDVEKHRNEYIELSNNMVIEKKADVVLLACTGMSTARLAPDLEQALGVPVVDPVITSGIAAYYAARGNAIRSEKE
jgi:allantoin racemase